MYNLNIPIKNILHDAAASYFWGESREFLYFSFCPENRSMAHLNFDSQIAVTKNNIFREPATQILSEAHCCVKGQCQAIFMNSKTTGQNRLPLC